MCPASDVETPVQGNSLRCCVPTRQDSSSMSRPLSNAKPPMSGTRSYSRSQTTATSGHLTPMASGRPAPLGRYGQRSDLCPWHAGARPVAGNRVGAHRGDGDRGSRGQAGGRADRQCANTAVEACPLDQLAASVRRADPPQRSARLHDRGAGDLHHLITSFNAIPDRLETERGFGERGVAGRPGE